MKKPSKIGLIRAITGVTAGLVAIATSLSVMLTSYNGWKKYYDEAMAEKEHREYLQTLPFEFLGISAELADGVTFYDNDSADPEVEDFLVKANFTEKGVDFSERLSPRDYTIDVPENFAKAGGTISFTYYYTPEKKEGETESPEPIKAETSLDIALVTPDASVYKVVKKPTFEEEGLAENVNGVQKVLPVLNMTDYRVEKNSAGTKYKFRHPETGVLIKIPIEAELTVYTTKGRAIGYDNVTCYFASDIEGLEIRYDGNGSFSFAGKEGSEAILDRISSKDTVTFTSGKIRLTGAVNVDRLILKSGATLSLQNTLTSNYILVEEGATLNVNTAGDAIVLKRIGDNNHGRFELNGTVNLTRDTTEEKLDKTGINLRRGSRLILGENCSLTIKKYGYTFGTWNDGGNGVVYMPKEAVYANKKITLGEKTLVDATESGAFTVWTDVKNITDYDVTVEPTDTTPGEAVYQPTGETVTLPALNYTDYQATIKNSSIIFTHKNTGVDFNFGFTETPLTIAGLTITSSNEKRSQTYTVAEGKEVFLEGQIWATNVILAGKGTLHMNGKISGGQTLAVKDSLTVDVTGEPPRASGLVSASTELTIEEGATLNITATGGAGDCLQLNSISTACAKAYLNGTLKVTGIQGATAISAAGGITKDNGDGTKTTVDWVKIYLTKTSRVSVTGATFGLYQFAYSSAKQRVTVYYPEGATVKGATIAMNGETLYSVSGNTNVLYEAYTPE